MPMRRMSKIRMMLATVVALAGFVLSQDVRAAEGAIPFNIEAQNLSEALNQFALQSGREILFSAIDTANKRSEKLSGEYTAEQALEILLKASGLAYRIDELDTVLIGSVS